MQLTPFVSFFGCPVAIAAVLLSGALASGCTETPSSFPPCVNPNQPNGGCSEDAGSDADAGTSAGPDAGDGSLDAAADAADGS